VTTHDPNHVHPSHTLTSARPRRLRRTLALGAVALGLAVAAPLTVAASAQAAPSALPDATRVVVWKVPAGFDNRFGQPQTLSASTTGCGDYQVDVYRYAYPSDIAFVDHLVATGVLHNAGEDAHVFVSSTDVVSTATCAPGTAPQAPAQAASVNVAAGAPVDPASPSLAFTGSTDTALGLGIGGGIAALGLGLVLWTRRRATRIQD
jgi:hypothetical protein